MFSPRPAVVLAVLISSTLLSQPQAGTPHSAPPIAITDTTVIPMDSERVLEHVTVVVENGKITQVGPAASTVIPAQASLIDGRGKFLIPGLADMHSHVDRKEMLPLFLAAGVTTTLNMGLTSPQFITQTRADLEQGKLAGPRFSPPS
jgi:cytosine/adenosine deaminase-related metal-dependent hydrolase